VIERFGWVYSLRAFLHAPAVNFPDTAPLRKDCQSVAGRMGAPCAANGGALIYFDCRHSQPTKMGDQSGDAREVRALGDLTRIWPARRLELTAMCRRVLLQGDSSLLGFGSRVLGHFPEPLIFRLRYRTHSYVQL
jgi:hypothetical protein